MMALLVLGFVLFVTNPWFTVIDDEVTAFEVATHPAGQLLHSYWIGNAPYERPPLFDLILHAWVRITGGNLRVLRLPSIPFYLGGLWLLARSAAQLRGQLAGEIVLLIGMLWPYGFHFGRLAMWYSCTFFFVALVTYAYLRLQEQGTTGRWVLLTSASLALIYSNYFGWAVLACLAVDMILWQRTQRQSKWPGIIASIIFLIAGYIPFWRSFVQEIGYGRRWEHSFAGIVTYTGFTGYVLFLSESVAPWFWRFSLPALLAIGVCLSVVAFRGMTQEKRFLFYFFVLFMAMAGLGILTTKRAILTAPWLLLPVGTTLATLVSKAPRRALALSLATIFAIGWFGIVSRKYYAAPRFLEPWDEVGREAARQVEHGALVIGNHPSFFFYLTVAMQNPSTTNIPHLNGVLTYSIFHPLIYQPGQWMEAGRPLTSSVVLVQGVPFRVDMGEMEGVQQLLAQRCRLNSLYRVLSDTGYKWKQRFLPDLGQGASRIEIRNYSCSQ